MMRRLYAEVLLLMQHNAWHRKGVRINDLTLPQIFNHIHDETSELYQAMSNPPEYTLRKEGKAEEVRVADPAYNKKPLLVLKGTPHKVFNEISGALTTVGAAALNDIQLSELSDILCILYHVMARKGWDPSLVEHVAVDKLNQRWSLNGPVEAKPD